MGIRSGLAIIFLLAVPHLIAGCSDDGGKKNPPAAPGTGDSITIDVGSESVTLMYAKGSAGAVFPTGADDSGTAELTNSFYLQETELTNAQSAVILQWAYDHGKFDTEDPGAHNYLSSSVIEYGHQQLYDFSADGYGNSEEDYNTQVRYAAGAFSVRNSMDDYPTTNITWYGCAMLCNWLTEMQDGNTDNAVYTGIPVDGATWESNLITADFGKTGFRIPTLLEFEYAARYRGPDSTNTVSGYSNPYFTQGDSASGATADYTDDAATAAVAVCDGAGLAEVRTKAPNALGFYDLTGNVWEWAEAYGTASANGYGASWDRGYGDAYLQIGASGTSNSADDHAFHEGFRMAKTR